MTAITLPDTDQLAADRQDLHRALNEFAVRRGRVVLASGKVSDYYANCKEISLRGEPLLWTTRLFWELIADSACEAVGGMTLGADPLVGALCLYSAQVGKPLKGLIVRKQAKGHGTQSQVEGPLTPGLKVALIEDVTPTGGSSIKAGRAIEAAGGKIVIVVSILNRQEGADDAFAEVGWKFRPIFTREELDA